MWEMTFLNITPRVVFLGHLGLLCFFAHLTPLSCIYNYSDLVSLLMTYLPSYALLIHINRVYLRMSFHQHKYRYSHRFRSTTSLFENLRLRLCEFQNPYPSMYCRINMTSHTDLQSRRNIYSQNLVRLFQHSHYPHYLLLRLPRPVAHLFLVKMKVSRK